MRQSLEGLVIGLLVGILDVSIFKFVLHFLLSTFDALGAVSFWVVVGYFIHNTAPALPAVIRGILFALAIGMPWLLDSANKGAVEEIPMLIVIFSVFGALTGIVSGLYARSVKNQTTTA